MCIPSLECFRGSHRFRTCMPTWVFRMPKRRWVSVVSHRQNHIEMVMPQPCSWGAVRPHHSDGVACRGDDELALDLRHQVRRLIREGQVEEAQRRLQQQCPEVGGLLNPSGHTSPAWFYICCQRFIELIRCLSPVRPKRESC